MYYRICQYCGAHLDPQEICDCFGDMQQKPQLKEHPIETIKASTADNNTSIRNNRILFAGFEFRT